MYLFERARKRGREGKIDLLSAGSSWVLWMMEALGPTRWSLYLQLGPGTPRLPFGRGKLAAALLKSESLGCATAPGVAVFRAWPEWPLGRVKVVSGAQVPALSCVARGG